MAVFPFDEGKANLLAGPGNIRAAVPTSGRVIKSHRASLGELGNEGTGWRMPSHPPPCTPSPPPPLPPPPTLPPPSSTGAQPEPGTGGGVEHKYQHSHKCMDKLHLHVCEQFEAYAYVLSYSCSKYVCLYTSREHESTHTQQEVDWN